MPLYHVPAQGSRDNEGISPVFPDSVEVPSWVGNYDEDSHYYIIRTEMPIKGLEPIEEGVDVGIPYDNLVPIQSTGAPIPEEQGAAAGEPPMDETPVPPITTAEPKSMDAEFIDAN